MTQSAIVNQEMVSTIAAEIKDITLADGSSVWLNEKTTFNFPDKFRGDFRAVELSGEGFFSIVSTAENRETDRRKQVGNPADGRLRWDD